MIDQANTLVSCSNDTTIKIWRLSPFDEYFDHAASQGSPMTMDTYSTLDDHTDYVRAIDYA